MRNKFVYSYSKKKKKSPCLGIWWTVEKHFCILLVMETFSIQKVVKMLEEVVVGWREVRWIWQIKQNSVVQFIPFLKHWLCDMQSSIFAEKSWAPSVDQYWLQVLQFSVHLINLLSILLRCNDFTGILQAVVDQTGSRQPTNDHNLFFLGASLASGSALELLLCLTSELVIADCRIQSTFHCTSKSDQEMVCCCCVE